LKLPLCSTEDRFWANVKPAATNIIIERDNMLRILFFLQILIDFKNNIINLSPAEIIAFLQVKVDNQLIRTG
jgi:hypothetical protein